MGHSGQTPASGAAVYTAGEFVNSISICVRQGAPPNYSCSENVRVIGCCLLYGKVQHLSNLLYDKSTVIDLLSFYTDPLRSAISGFSGSYAKRSATALTGLHEKKRNATHFPAFGIKIRLIA